VLVQKPDPSDRSEDRRPGQGPLIYPDTPSAKRPRPQDQLSCTKKRALEPNSKLNRRECERELVHLDDAIAWACGLMKRRASNGGEVDTAYISALSALGGAAIGGLASFGSSWLTQRTQLRFSHHEAVKAQRAALYAEFVNEAARLYGDALGHQKDEVADLVKIYALVGRMMLVSPRSVVTAAERTLDTIIEAYLGPNRTLHEVLDEVHQGGFTFFAAFGEACRQDLGRD
jgi:hypothetical protein